MCSLSILYLFKKENQSIDVHQARNKWLFNWTLPLDLTHIIWMRTICVHRYDYKKGIYLYKKKKRERTLVTHIDRIFPWFVSLILTFVSLMIRIAFFFLSHCLLFFRTNALTSDFSYFLFHVKLKKRWISKQRNGG